MRLRWGIDLLIEPHAFARMDFDMNDPFVRGNRNYRGADAIASGRYPSLEVSGGSAGNNNPLFIMKTDWHKAQSTIGL